MLTGVEWRVGRAGKGGTFVLNLRDEEDFRTEGKGQFQALEQRFSL